MVMGTLDFTFIPHICCERREDQKRYKLETHDDIPEAIPDEKGVNLVRPVRCASEDVLVDMNSVARTVVDEIHAFLDLTKRLLKGVVLLFLRKTREKGGVGMRRRTRGGWMGEAWWLAEFKRKTDG